MEKRKAPVLKALKETATSAPFSSKESRTYDPRPVIRISESDLPEILKWPIDGKYKLTVEVEMTGINEEEYPPNKGKKVASLKVTKIGVTDSE